MKHAPFTSFILLVLSFMPIIPEIYPGGASLPLFITKIKFIWVLA